MGPDVLKSGGVWRMTSAGGLVLDIASHPDSGVLTEFFAGYDAAFVLPDEKEDLDGFRACLELGHGEARQRLLRLYGPHVETVAVFALVLLTDLAEAATAQWRRWFPPRRRVSRERKTRR